MNCDYDSFPYRDKENEEESEKREEEFYRNILGLKESYGESLDLKWEDEEDRSLEDKIEKSKKDLGKKIKREISDLMVTVGSISAGLLLSYESLLKFNNYNNGISWTSRLIFPVGLGLITYGFYRSLKRLSRK